MKKMIFLSITMLTTAVQANSLSKRLWRELEQAKHKTEIEKIKEQDMAWLENSNSLDIADESVDQVMAEFNRSKKMSPTSSEDSISLKMAAPKRIQKTPNAHSMKAPQSKKKASFPLTRERSR